LWGDIDLAVSTSGRLLVGLGLRQKLKQKRHNSQYCTSTVIKPWKPTNLAVALAIAVLPVAPVAPAR
jgi:hypothetical protein